ncbi:MAG: hypothetical protein BZ137_00285 [Methanosphaera sp. rholeuAM130]|nr:MAG: hypothetical protein BZ137_00285 [Methanosphaera sp. rholeuAM130]
MSMTLTNNIHDFDKMDYCLNLIETPFNNGYNEKNIDYTIINNFNLNISNFRKYYPEIRENTTKKQIMS